MKRLLFVIPTMRMGGAEQSLISLLRALDHNRYEVDLLLFEKKGELLERVPQEVNIIAADTITRAMLLEFRYFYKDLLREKHFLSALVRLLMLMNSKAEIVLGRKLIINWNIAKHMIKKLPKEYDVAIGYLEGATDAYVIDKVNAKKKIGWIHSDFSSQDRNQKEEGKYYRQFNQIAIISEKCRNSFLEIYPDMVQRTCMIENMSNTELILLLSKEQIVEDTFQSGVHIVTVGRLEEAKGIDIALETAIILRNSGHNFKWHVFGDGVLRSKLEKDIKEHDMQDYFILEGITKNPYKYMRIADIIVQSSRYEGKSIVLDEAKILCRPIVVTNYPSAKDQIKDGVTGLISETAPEMIAKKIEIILNDPELKEKLVNNCKLEKDKSLIALEKIITLIEGE